jgi:hypothetical protein
MTMCEGAIAALDSVSGCTKGAFAGLMSCHLDVPRVSTEARPVGLSGEILSMDDCLTFSGGKPRW